MVLSYTYSKQAQFNTIVVQQEEMDRVGVEPTTSAWRQSLSEGSYKKENFSSSPTCSTFFLYLLAIIPRTPLDEVLRMN
jgi:hypothetical protein